MTTPPPPLPSPTTTDATAPVAVAATVAVGGRPDAGESPVEGVADPTAPVTVRDFVTDASLVAFCDELSRMTGVPIWLRDGPEGPDARAIVPGEGAEGPGGTVSWRIVPETAAAARAFSLAGRPHDPGAPTVSAPLRISSGELGALVMARSSGDGAEDRPLRNALARLAATVSEGCESQVTLRQRVLELDALYRLSSLLVRSEDTDEVLTIALDLAIEAMHADAGSVAVLEDPGEDLVVKASRGLSPEWVQASARAALAGQIRHAALAGEVVCVDDLATDARFEDHARARAEGLAGLICTGLMYQGRAIGLIRLYSRRPRAFSRAERGLLRSIADQSAAAVVNARLRRLREENERVRRQVRLAADVQRRMLPRAVPQVKAFDVAARYAPSFELGGDFYDFINLGGHLGVVVGDVVGKGVPAALLMSAVRASLRAHAQDVYDLSEVLSRVNAALAADTRDDEFATLWYGVADPVALRLTYCNAGHNPPLLVRPPAGGTPPTVANVFELAEGGMALGIDLAHRYTAGLCQLAPGDLLVAYTDGLVDAATFSGRRFGKPALLDAILGLMANEPAASAARVLDHIFWHLRQFTGLRTRTDDVTVVVLRVRGRS